MSGYPLIDRSGVEEDSTPFSARGPSPPVGGPVEIEVCHAGTCFNNGAEATLTEIEELITAVGGKKRCSVRQTGCLSQCRRGPAVLVTPRGGAPKVHSRIRSLDASAKLVERAIGVRPLLNSGLRETLANIRSSRAWRSAAEVFHWNRALQLLTASNKSESERFHSEKAQELLARAGFNDDAVSGTVMPTAIESYTKWRLESVEPVSKHCAVYHFNSDDRKRGTPHPRGRGRVLEPKTWHTTLLAEVGENEEGPLPWVEREYTPVSTGKDWESGRCDLLVKVYPDGTATTWLQKQALGTFIWLSKPQKTLGVPALTEDSTGFRPASVLLLLAGTGIVALPQILHHRDPIQMLSITTPKRDQLEVPIELVLSCREDDVLFLSEIAQWCRGGNNTTGLRHCTLLLTPASTGAAPFANVYEDNKAIAENLMLDLPNLVIKHTRINASIVTVAYSNMPRPCRVVVSGPGGFNTAVQQMLASVIDDPDHITTLTA